MGGAGGPGTLNQTGGTIDTRNVSWGTIIAYDMDSKELTSAWKVDGWTGTDQDGRRMLLTMAYVAASRLLLANSFRDLKPEVLHDLERTFPYPSEPRSARPVDAFTHAGWPRVYDFAVTPDWHQVTFFNNALPTREQTITVPLAGHQPNRGVECQFLKKGEPTSWKAQRL